MSARDELNEEARVELARPISNEEIKCAMFSIKPNKSPGLDGFRAFFYQTSKANCRVKCDQSYQILYHKVGYAQQCQSYKNMPCPEEAMSY